MVFFKDFTDLDVLDLNFSALLIIKSMDGKYHFCSGLCRYKLTGLKETATYINKFFLNP